MTKEDLAKYLDGCEYGMEFTSATAAMAKASRLVIVYGSSDDLTEFDGFIRDEAGLGESFIVNGKVVCSHECNCDQCGWNEYVRGGIRIVSDFGAAGFTVTCSVPHAKFFVMEDGQKYGEGLVFQIYPQGDPA